MIEYTLDWVNEYITVLCGKFCVWNESKDLCTSEFDTYEEATSCVLVNIKRWGVISSLVKKGLVEVLDQEGEGKLNDITIMTTKEGAEVCKALCFDTVS